MTLLEQNIAKLYLHLTRFENEGFKYRIAGQDVGGKGGFFYLLFFCR